MDNDEDKLEAGLALVGIIILFIGVYELVGYDKMTWWIPLGFLAAFSPFAIQRHRQKQEASLLQEKAVQEAEKIAEINRTAKAGTWNFPTEEFYKRCFEGKIENLGSDYGWKKAKVIAEQLILEKCPKADMLNRIASFRRLLVSISPFTPKQRNLSSTMLVWPLKYRLSEPTHMEWIPRQISRSISWVYRCFSPGSYSRYSFWHSQ